MDAVVARRLGMAKKNVADNVKFSDSAVLNSGKIKAAVPDLPSVKAGSDYSAQVSKLRGRKGPEDELLEDQAIVVASAESAAPDSAIATADQPTLVAQVDASTTPLNDPARIEQAPVASSGSNAGWWWLGAGLVAVGAGVASNNSGGTGSGATVTGRVTDGPVQGAKIYNDVNANGKYDVGTDTAILDANGNQVVTDAQGNFTFNTTQNPATTRLVTHGGTDTVTGEAVTIDFAAPAGYTQINPITSMIASIMEANPGYTAAQAEAAVEAALGLPDLDFANLDLFNPATNLDVQKAAAILATAAVVVEQSGAGTDAFGYLAASMGSGGSTDALVTSLCSDPSVAGTAAATQLVNTVAAIESAATIDAIGTAVIDNFYSVNVVVDSSGAWIDLNANGVTDAEDTTAADFTPGTGNTDFAANTVTIHYNDNPGGDISLAGFGLDDRIEIDVQAFIDNGHNALNILSIPDITGNSLFTSKTYAGFSNTGNSNTNTIRATVRLLLSAGRLTLFSRNGSSSPLEFTLPLASALPTDITLQQMVDFVNLPAPPATVHVVVEREGAVIDYNGDGVRDNGENRLADFGPGGSADLAGATPVTIHFNDIPQNALDLTGFGTDDKIEFDVQAMRNNSIFSSSTPQLNNFNTSSSQVLYTFSSSPSGVRIAVMQNTSTTVTTFNGTRSSVYALKISNISISSQTNGAFAYWNSTDTNNALNSVSNVLPGYTGGNTSAVLATLNSTAPHSGLVEFIWNAPTPVV